MRATSRRAASAVPACLIALSLVPALAGIGRLRELSIGAAITPENARFFAAPLPVALHVAAVIPFSILGALQFAPAFRRSSPGWHRVAGLILVACGATAAITGLWMAHTYPWPKSDGVWLYFLRLAAGGAMLVCLLSAVAAIRRRNFRAHGAWMLRAYAIGMGAGTQVLTHLPYFVLIGEPDEVGRTVMMGAGWAINVAVAEAAIHYRRTAPAARSTHYTLAASY